ncbi:MAG: DUF368 domain-containing protein [Methanocorpusculum sp.]|nr:DUF368 domain-containing protein [Methanocorpusculum sp.]
MNILGSILNVFRGACMAVADSVPGVSGGTIAFILGFYDKFINSVHDFLMGSWDERKKAFPFLFFLAIGWVCAFLICSVIISKLFDEHIYEISSMFIGLTLFAIPIVIYEEKACLKGKYLNLLFTVIGAILVPLIVILGSSAGVTEVNLAQITIGLVVFLFVSAIVAICAMVLPGISGSTILLIMGIYVPMISAVSSLAHLDFTYLPALIIFGLGMIAGFFVASKVIKKCLERFRSQTIYLVLGLLVGSVYAIVMGTKSVGAEAMNFTTFSILFFIIGGVVILGLQFVKMRMEKRAGN